MRLFVALPVDDAALGDRLASIERELSPEGARGILRSQLHFTLKFLGEVEEARLGPAREAMRSAAGPSFQLELAGLGTFPPRGPARIVWAGCGSGADLLIDLAARVEASFAAVGFPPEPRPFSPHLTIARVKDPVAGKRVAQAVAGRAPATFGTLSAREVILFQSVLSPSGPAYTPLLRVPLAAAC